MSLLYTLKKHLNRSVYNANVRRNFHHFKALSVRYIKPNAPKVHHFVFETMKRHIKKRIIQNLMPLGVTQGVDLSELFACDKDKKKSGISPFVTIIVPNYNHESFLRQRLESIYGQSYRNFEVILLDDKSSDASVAILKEYAERYAAITRLIVNEENSGGVFHQWKRGIAHAAGELIWIAESDDFCSSNFLETLMPFFDNDAVMLAYVKSIFVQDEKEIWSINDYLSDINSELWNKQFISSAHILVNEAWGIKNIVPNASSAVFRNPKGMAILDDAVWQSMRICGDWVFYLHVIRGGLVGYTPEATNYYRLHDANTSVATYAKDVYYAEHAEVAACLCKLYRLEESVLEKQSKNLEAHWDSYMGNREKKDFSKVYNLAWAKSFQESRKPNIMMVTFALAAGGGETLPIKIANMFSTLGYGVTMVSLQQDYENPAIRSMLLARIPLVKINFIERFEAIALSMGVEIVHSHHAWVDLSLVALLQDNREIKMVISTHGMYEIMGKKEFEENFSLLEPRVDKIIYTAEKNLVPFLSVTHRKDLLVKIGNALEPSVIIPAKRSEFNIREDAFVLCLVSRAIAPKGWEEAIKSVTMAREISSADIHLLLIGEGEEYSRLRPIVKEEFIHFCGFKSNIRDYFAMSDLGFLPSRFEGESFPLVIIDSFYANRPVLASNIGEISSMLQADGCCAGALFDLDAMQIPIQKVASLIVRFATDKLFYETSCEAISKVISRYDPKEMVAKYAAVYEEITKKEKLMIVGGGMLANAFAKYVSDEDRIIFASGVSNSSEENHLCFEREKNLLLETIQKYPLATLIYFGTCSVDDTELAHSAYVEHKIAMEFLIQKKSKRYFIFRLSQVVGKSKSPTLINFLVEKIKRGEEFSVWGKSSRNIIDIDDVFKIADHLIEHNLYVNEITNIAAPSSLSIFAIVAIIEELANKKGFFHVAERGGSYTIDINKIKPYFNQCGVSFDSVYARLSIKKYFFEK